MPSYATLSMLAAMETTDLLKVGETDFLNAVRAHATRRGWLVNHIRRSLVPAENGQRWAIGAKGFPDLVLARAGVVLFWELKTERGDPTPEQVVWLEATGGSVRRPRHARAMLDALE